jgi:hypothetical protein
MAYQEPKDFLDNGKVMLDNSYLKVTNSKNFHHFFPRSYLRKNKIDNENSIVNITLVSDHLNKRKIKAKAPSNYIREFLDQNEKLPESMKSHFIKDLDSYGIWSDDYEVFLQQRAKSIYEELKKRIDLTHEQDNPELEAIKELILEGEGQKMELKSSLRYDIRENKLNKKLEYVIAKTINAFLNSD